MKPDSRFLLQPKSFWANIRSLSQHIGYTKKKQIHVPSLIEVEMAFKEMGLSSSHVIKKRKITPLGRIIIEYFEYRAALLNHTVEPLLMDADEARAAFEDLARKQKFKCAIPMNKQKGRKRAPAYFTGIINMMIESNCEDVNCDYAPRELTTLTHDGIPVRTLARWVDGAFPRAVNPIAIWEIKEYYYTTTFGSRVADGVYESLLDGMELEELEEHEGIKVLHYLMVDSHNTWWMDGKSYLCRLIDMLHMGYVDEILFGKEVLSRMPGIVRSWVQKERNLKRR